MSEVLTQIDAMHECAARGGGPDVIIVVSSTREEADFWGRRLHRTKNLICGQDTKIICVDEDWPGGAGNLLGTLYAFVKASQEYGGSGLAGMMKSGRSVHMYHTAGKGTRLYPLPAVECGSKPAVKLPRMLETNAGVLPITILEAVIFQTAVFARSRGGRMSVWWGDQVFIPSISIDKSPAFHAEIVTQLLTVSPDMESYGLILPGDGGAIESLREKQSWGAILELVGEGGVAGKSIGSFSLSAALLEALLAEFDGELAGKDGKLDTDPHLWQPATTKKSDYVSRGGDGAYWDRISAFKERFLASNSEKGYLGYVDIGEGSLWWDFGSTDKLFANLMKLVSDEGEEMEAMRAFFAIGDPLESSSVGSAAVEDSVLLASTVESGSVRGSIVIDTRIGAADVDGCIITSSALSSLHGEGALIYGCMEDSELTASKGEVICDIALPETGLVRMKTDISRDGKTDWDNVMPGNEMSYGRLSKIISDTGIAALERERAALIRSRGRTRRKKLDP